jgi:hypothetical protein
MFDAIATRVVPLPCACVGTMMSCRRPPCVHCGVQLEEKEQDLKMSKDHQRIVEDIRDLEAYAEAHRVRGLPGVVPPSVMSCVLVPPQCGRGRRAARCRAPCQCPVSFQLVASAHCVVWCGFTVWWAWRAERARAPGGGERCAVARERGASAAAGQCSRASAGVVERAFVAV